MTFMILHVLASMWQDVLARCKNLAKFHARFWQDNVRQEMAKTSYINLAKFLARLRQDHAKQSVKTRNCQDVLQVSCKILARLRQESCMILERFGTCKALESTALALFLSYS